MNSIKMMSSVRSAVCKRIASPYSTAASSQFTPLTALETRWGKLPEAEQGAIADAVAVAEKGDWKKMTLEQKRAAYYIAYGPYGARNPQDPALKWSVLYWSTGFIGLSYLGYLYWDTQKPKVRTMTPEWKAAEAERAKANKENPYTLGNK